MKKLSYYKPLYNGSLKVRLSSQSLRSLHVGGFDCFDHQPFNALINLKRGLLQMNRLRIRDSQTVHHTTGTLISQMRYFRRTKTQHVRFVKSCLFYLLRKSYFRATVIYSLEEASPPPPGHAYLTRFRKSHEIPKISHAKSPRGLTLSHSNQR